MRSVRCERRRQDDAILMLPDSGLQALVAKPDDFEIDFSHPVLYLPALNMQHSLIVLQHLVSECLLAGRPGRFFHCPGWAGRGWEFQHADHLSPSYASYAFPDLSQGGPEWLESQAQCILARVQARLPTAVASFGPWSPRGPVESLLLLELSSC